MKRILLFITFFVWSISAFAWGFWAHERINHIAVFLLPPGMVGFYKQNISYITKHAVDADKRRYSSPDEAPRHYIDLDHYCVYPCTGFPHTWKEAVAKYSEDTLKAYGTVPWRIEQMMYRLTEAFKAKDKRQILKCSADLGHYIADSNVPLHTTENYNGQMTDQVGIHALWESRIPELLGDDYDYFVGKAAYVSKPNSRIWKAILESHHALDTVFGAEKALSERFGADRKFTYETRGKRVVRMYSEAFTQAYSDTIGGMVERQLRNAIQEVADFWFTCWVNAGSPDLNDLTDTPMTDEEKQSNDKEDQSWKVHKKQYGHEHPENGSE